MDQTTVKGSLPQLHGGEATLLFVIPHSSHSAYVWCSASKLPSITSIVVDGAPVAILDRKKLFRPGNSLEILFVEGREFREGIACDLYLDTREAERSVVTAAARLARWDHPHTPRVLRFIADRFSRVGDPPRTLERFLAFTSVWQAPGLVLAAFPEGSIVEIGAALPGDGIDAYVVAMEGLRHVAPTPLSSGRGRARIWLPEVHPAYLYLDCDGTLIRITLSEADSLPPASPPLTGAESAELIDALHRLEIAHSPSIDEWVAKHCSVRAEIRLDDATYRVLAAARLPSGNLAIFMELEGPPYRDARFHVQSFGGADLAEIAVTVREADTQPQTRAGRRTQIVIEATGLEPHGAILLTWEHADEPCSAWIREARVTDVATQSVVRDFAPVALVDDTLLFRILHPLATAVEGDIEPHLVHRAAFGPRDCEIQAEVFVFAGHDIEALHRTLIGLSCSTRDTPCHVHVCFFDRSLTNSLTDRVRHWAALYGLAIGLLGFSAGTPEAHAAEYASGNALPRILCRAGSVPRHADWLPKTLGRLKKAPAGILLGVEAVEAPAGKLPPHAFELLLGADPRGAPNGGVTATAFVPGPDLRLSSELKLFGLEAFILGIGLLSSAKNEVIGTPELSFAQSGTVYRQEIFEAALDSYSLQNLHKSFFTSKPKSIKVRRRT